MNLFSVFNVSWSNKVVVDVILMNVLFLWLVSLCVLLLIYDIFKSYSLNCILLLVLCFYFFCKEFWYFLIVIGCVDEIFVDDFVINLSEGYEKMCKNVWKWIVEFDMKL